MSDLSHFFSHLDDWMKEHGYFIAEQDDLALVNQLKTQVRELEHEVHMLKQRLSENVEELQQLRKEKEILMSDMSGEQRGRFLDLSARNQRLIAEADEALRKHLTVSKDRDLVLKALVDARQEIAALHQDQANRAFEMKQLQSKLEEQEKAHNKEKDDLNLDIDSMTLEVDYLKNELEKEKRRLQQADNALIAIRKQVEEVWPRGEER